MALQVVTDGDRPKCSIAEQIRAAAEQAISEGALAFLCSYETATDFHTKCIPEIVTLRDGMHRAAWMIHQGAAAGEE